MLPSEVPSQDKEDRPICNLYNLTTNQQAIRDVARAMTDSLGNLEPNLDIYPDRPAPVVRNTADGRELVRLTWGMPTPPQFLKTKDAPDTGVTNIRNTRNPHWRCWLGVENRCLVPGTAFSEYGQKLDPATKRKPLHWFALDESRPFILSTRREASDTSPRAARDVGSSGGDWTVRPWVFQSRE
jgi:putative SOS response-associated peptidase YedK